MSRHSIPGSQILRRFIQQAESYNRCMFPSSKPSRQTDDHVTEQILFCQNAMEDLHLAPKKPASPPPKEILLADVTSNGYHYETSSLELNVIQQCCIVSIISPDAFTVQLSRDLLECDAFFKLMNDYYNSISDLQISPEYLRKNLLCVTWDGTVSAWNRSQIMEYDSIDDTVNVFYVDLNSWEEHVPRARIRFILTKFSARPVRLLTCRLAAVGPLSNSDDRQWTDVVSKTFQNVVNNCQCDVEPLHKGRDNTFYVNLFASHDEAYVCVNDFLIHCKMARPVDDISNEKNLVYMLDDNGQPMHSMIALYWKAGEVMREAERSTKIVHDDRRSSQSDDSFQTKYSLSNVPLIKVVVLNTHERIVFARYNTYIMLPWFTISHLLNGLEEEIIKKSANTFGFKPIVIDPLSHPLLSSQLRKFISVVSISSQTSLYSIDCVRKLFQAYRYTRVDICEVLDRARLAEASDDLGFWEKAYEIVPSSP